MIIRDVIINETRDVYDVPGSTMVLIKELGGQAIVVKTPGGTFSLIVQFPTIGADDKEAKWVLSHLSDEQDA